MRDPQHAQQLSTAKSLPYLWSLIDAHDRFVIPLRVDVQGSNARVEALVTGNAVTLLPLYSLYIRMYHTSYSLRRKAAAKLINPFCCLPLVETPFF